MKILRPVQWMAALALLMCVMIPPDHVTAEDYYDSVVIPSVSYELSGNKKYDLDQAEQVAVMSFGSQSLGKMIVSGKNLEKATYNGMTAFGASGNVSFSYEFNKSLLSDNESLRHVVEDDTKKVIGQKLDADIQKGVLFIQHSENGEEYENVINPVVNFFGSVNSGKELYKISGDDLSHGMYYRIILAYKTAVKDGEFLGRDTFGYKRHIEVYNFFVVENSGQLSIHNLSLDEELINYEGYDQELLKHGETLEDNSITRDGFEIEKITDSYTVWVQHDSDVPVIANTGDRFTDDGVYTITLKTRLGKEKVFRIYVFKGGKDKGFSKYFGDGLVQAERVFREGDVPTYARGGRIHIKGVESNIPPLCGEVINTETNEVAFQLSGSRAPQCYSLKPGTYIAEFHNASPQHAGSYYQYTFAFNVLDEESAPYVNYHNLLTASSFENLQSKHLEVAYQMTSGGYIYVCFSMDSEEEALQYAQEIEGRFVERSTGNSFYYKSEENPNRKVRYYDRLELTRVRNEYAAQNVEVGYFNPLDKCTYRTYDNNLLNSLENINSSESIVVFPSEDEKGKLYDRAPFMNNFKFIQVSDYDVVSVSAENLSDGSVTELKFNVPVSSQLSETGIYKITETNCYGKSRSYEACFVTSCETSMTWQTISDGEKRTIHVSASDCQDGPYVIQADSAYVTSIDNPFDEHAIVTIKAPNVYSFEIKCLATEFQNLEFTKAGEYDICFIDRLGNSFNVLLKISGGTQSEEKQSGNISYVEFYNTIYQNPKNVEEDVCLLSDIVAATASDNSDTKKTGPTGALDNSPENKDAREQDDGAFKGTPWIISAFGLIVFTTASLIWHGRKRMKSSYIHETDEGIEDDGEDSEEVEGENSDE